MATVPTNKPIPSEDPRDLKFNAGKIDEVVTSDAHYYTDRFGVRRWTIAGFQYTAEEAIRNYGYITMDSFEDGATLTLPNQVLRYEATGEYYRWDGDLPKSVSAGSTPYSTGEVKLGAWVSVGDAAIRSELAKDSGFNLIGGATYSQIRNNITATTRIYCIGKDNIFDGGFGFFEVDPLDTTSVDNGGTILVDASGRRWKRQHDGDVNLAWFAKGEGVTDDAAAFQAAIDATALGGKLTIPAPTTYYKIGTTLTINKAITIEGTGGSAVYNSQMPCVKVSGSISAFKLVPTLDGYRFGYGISGVKFNNLMIEGQEISSRGLYAISVDESVNHGVYHIRECDFSGVHIRYFETGIRLLGTVYLNSFYNVHVLWCGNGCHIDKVDGATEGNSDQNRFFGCEFVLNNIGMVLSNVAYSGSQSIIGCTISENTTAGIVAGYNTVLYISGSQIEANGIGVNITIPSGVTNPSTEGSKTIFGNWFLSNNYDIWVVKETTALTGGFAFPLNIQSNTFAQTKERVLYVQAPTGAGEFDSRQFILGSSNSYSGTDGVVGLVPPSMIETDWKGYNGFKEDGKVTLSCRMVGTDLTNVGMITIPYGKQCYIRYSCVSIPSLVSAGRTQSPASIEFINVNNASSPVVIHQGTLVRSGEFLIGRVSSETSVSINLNASGSDLAGLAEVEYCIL